MHLPILLAYALISVTYLTAFAAPQSDGSVVSRDHELETSEAPFTHLFRRAKNGEMNEGNALGLFFPIPPPPTGHIEKAYGDSPRPAPHSSSADPSRYGNTQGVRPLPADTSKYPHTQAAAPSRQSGSQSHGYQSPAPSSSGSSAYYPSSSGSSTYYPSSSGTSRYYSSTAGSSTYHAGSESSDKSRPRPQRHNSYAPQSSSYSSSTSSTQYRPPPQRQNTYQPQPQRQHTYQPQPASYGHSASYAAPQQYGAQRPVTAVQQQPQPVLVILPPQYQLNPAYQSGAPMASYGATHPPTYATNNQGKSSSKGGGVLGKIFGKKKS
ncbi:hypothetical protein K474DRAFT_1678287 [Panus rudis PR-1116 ss-1]|nr:hypothetical protein K474DRAFT_1678287 [Panus rudis PR-1116 ss-1]